VFIGIESPDPDSLKETRKSQNLQEDPLASLRRIYSYGIDVLAGFIVGFDNDTLETFDHQFRFIQVSGIQAAMVGLLTALPKTALWQRLEREGRLIPDGAHADNTKLGTNFVPKGMSQTEMVSAYRRLYDRLLDDRAIAARVRAKRSYMAQPLYRGNYTRREAATIVWRLLVRGIAPGGPSRIAHFVRSLPLTAPGRIPQVILDWIAALAMRDYVRRHFDAGAERHAATAERLGRALTRALSSYLREGKVVLSLERAGSRLASFSVAVTDWPDRRFFARAARPMERILRCTAATLTLRIEALREHESEHLERLLRRLARYGDRVSIVVSESLRDLVHIDSSRFHLVLGGSGPGAP
jgi:hypothetical protein